MTGHDLTSRQRDTSPRTEAKPIPHAKGRDSTPRRLTPSDALARDHAMVAGLLARGS